MKKTAIIILLSFICRMVWAGEEEVVRLEPIVVTPSRFEASIEGISGTFSVIQNEEIENTVGDSIVDVLRKEEGILIREYYGTGIKASVDMRGFGEAAAMNTLVLIDGRRTNSVDLSGVDWHQISKESVERIEILRGAGSVLYGDNAAGGVINIITKKAKKPHGIKLEQTIGSYRAFMSNVQAEASGENFSLFMNVKRSQTDGYRENAYVKGTNFTGDLRYEVTDAIRCDLDGRYNNIRFGLPGALSESDLETRSRRDSKYPNDQSHQEDWYLRTQPQIKITDKVIFASGFGFRNREFSNDWGSSARDTNKTVIKTSNATPRISYRFLEDYELIAGFDFYKHDNETDDYARATGSLTATSDVDKTTRGYYAQIESHPKDKLFLSAGYRYEEAIYDFDYTDFSGLFADVDDSRRLEANAVHLGLGCLLFEKYKIYANFNKNFRLPATEEFLLYDWSSFPFGRSINIGLVSQRGYTYEVGTNLTYKDIAKIDINGFWMDIENEIYYDPYLFINRNYDDDTRRKGIEAQVKVDAAKYLDLYCNYTYTDAKFRGGDYSGNEIPAVPEHVVGIGTDVEFKDFLFNVDCRYVGKRRFISDQQNTKDYVKSYFVTDVGCTYTYKDVKFFFKVNNLFGRKYSEYGVRSAVYDTKNYYPSPERNVIAGVAISF